MEKLTKEELSFIIIVMTHVDNNKTASKPFNVLAEIGYDRVPKELEAVLIKLKKTN